MFDECHHIPATTAQQVMLNIPAWNRFGFSGTPLHHDNLSDMLLIGATGPVLVDVTNSDLIEAGVSAMPYVDMYVVESSAGFDEKWDTSYTKHIVHNKKRNRLITDVVQRECAHATLILVDRLDHGRILQEALPGSIFAHGGLPTDERKRILDKLRQGEGSVVIATPIFDEGVDVPSVDLLVLAAGGETHIRLLQRIGRGMRRKDSNTLKVVDFVDDTNKYLLTHSQHRAELYEAEGFAVRLVE
jgi:superfamily II DNA or RNA helicase